MENKSICTSCNINEITSVNNCISCNEEICMECYLDYGMCCSICSEEANDSCFGVSSRD